MKRRVFIQGCLAAPVLFAGCVNSGTQSSDNAMDEAAKSPQESDEITLDSSVEKSQDQEMYGIIGKMNATAGNREKLMEILLKGTKEMPGCKLYAISGDSTDANAIWITEIWESEEAHQASLKLPSVQNAIAEGRPMIAGFGDRHIVKPIGGLGVN